MPGLIDSFEQNYLLGVHCMDKTHHEFVDLVNMLDSAGKMDFISLFGKLVKHTEEHFTAENALMQETGFAAVREHMDEHQRVLGELNRIGARVAAGSTVLGRAYVRERLPAWFHLHVITMDSALAAHVKSRQARIA